MGDVVKFDFQGRGVRMVKRNGDPWWVLSDIGRVLELENAREITKRLDTDEFDVDTIYTSVGPRQAIIVSLPGLGKILASSRKPLARPFNRWLFHEVLPQIYHTGSYEGSDLSMQHLLSPFADAVRVVVSEQNQPILKGVSDICAFEKQQIKFQREVRTDLELIKQEVKTRRSLRKEVREEHINTLLEIGRRCPMCLRVEVINEFGCVLEAEWDHFYRNSERDAAHTWLICIPCHRELTHNHISRDAVTPQFTAYQTHRQRLGRLQMDLF